MDEFTHRPTYRRTHSSKVESFVMLAQPESFSRSLRAGSVNIERAFRYPLRTPSTAQYSYGPAQCGVVVGYNLYHNLLNLTILTIEISVKTTFSFHG